MPIKVFAAAPAITIHAFQIAGDSAYDEFVQVANDGATPIDLTNYTVSRKTKTATSWNTLYKFGTFTISPHQVVTIANAKYTGIADFTYSTSSYSLTTDNSIAVIAPDKTIIDLVGYGDASSFRGTPLPNPAAKEIFTRTQNTSNNLADFLSSVKATELDPNIDKVVISELMPNPSDGGEWFELYNETNLPVSLAGTKVCDAVGATHCYFFDTNKTLAPNEYKIYSASVSKITLNNTGDWLEFRDGSDNILADSGGNYGDADPGVSLALFGSEFQWTKTPTPAAQNLYTDTAEVETPTATKAVRTTTSKIKKTTVKTASASTDDPEVAGASTVSDGSANQNSSKSNANIANDSRNQLLGYALIGLAVLLLLGYNLWDKRLYVRNLYYKISRRDR